MSSLFSKSSADLRPRADSHPTRGGGSVSLLSLRGFVDTSYRPYRGYALDCDKRVAVPTTKGLPNHQRPAFAWIKTLLYV